MSRALVPHPALTGGLLIGLCLLVVASAYADPRAPFVGSWDLVSVENRTRDGSVTHRIEGSLFPNWSGRAQIRHYAFVGDTLSLSSPPFAAGGKTVAVHVVWRRAQAE